MTPLPAELRRELERAVIDAREVSERGARAALQVLGVDKERAFDEMSSLSKAERIALRARMRALGPSDSAFDAEAGRSPRGFAPLVEEVAYEQWHRMLFARFLAENGLLIHPTYGVAVSLEECAALTGEIGEPDEWMVAARFAAAMLPGIFRRDDPAVRVRLAPNDRADLERIVKNLAPDVFHADDALGWVYQFWQTQAKNEVNRSGRKVAGKDLAPVTQLFTEHYMVRFLLENSIGAWWAVRHPQSSLTQEWEYLRWRDDGTPATGSFEGWPAHAKDVTVMDPCLGSGHFLVAAAEMLRKMRMEEENISLGAAAEAVLRDNLFGLELDPRCTQLGAFALVFDAWKAGMDTKTPILPNVACSGVAVSPQLQDWKQLAGNDADLLHTLGLLYTLFQDAPELGSLIDPKYASPRDQLFSSRYEDVAPLLQQALGRSGEDPVAAVFGAAAEGAERAGKLLARQYVLVATNPPYLGRDKQGQRLKDFADHAHPDAKANLATMFIQRCRAFTADGCSYSLVTPQNWLFLASYKRLRIHQLKEQTWNYVARLGSGAFDTITGEVVNVALVGFEQHTPPSGHAMLRIDASAPRLSAEKSRMLRDATLATVEQAFQLRNPDSRIVLGNISHKLRPLSEFASTYEGLHTGDYPRFGRTFWEIPKIADGWARQQETTATSTAWGGRANILFWERGKGALMRFVQERLGSETVSRWIKGEPAWGKRGVAVGAMGQLRPTLYDGALFTHGVYAVIPKDEEHLSAIWAYLQSDDFRSTARALDQKLAIARAVFDGLPFDLPHWQKIADELYPNGLPEPNSDDPTQWLFKGNIVDSDEPLQVAVARILGYRWPDQSHGNPGSMADKDGIVCLPGLLGERDAAERLRASLAGEYGDLWAAGTLPAILARADSAGKSLEQWLRDGFFEQHCSLFQNRPFIWQVWDGRRDGFSVLVNYHKLDRPTLEKLAFTYLGAWLERQRDEKSRGVAGADDRLAAASELQGKLRLILEGEQPHDIYVRWKPLAEQPIGWEPDINDGVRLNIRPFMTAGVLRSNPNITWKNDRGNDREGRERRNDRHYTLAEKRAAREGRHR